MKIIDLLNKIANGEEVPKKIKLLSPTMIDDFRICTFNGYSYVFKDDTELSIIFGKLELNDEVEILEEEKKIPEKLDWNKNDFTYPEGNLMSEETADMLMEIQDKVNFILDYLKNKGE